MKQIFAFERFNRLERALFLAKAELRRLWATNIVGLAAQDRSLRRWRGEGDTPLDILCETIIVSAIRENCPELTIFSEEGGLVHRGEEAAGSCLVDPLDATHNAYGGYPAFSANVAFHDGETYVFGWVYDLSRDVTYTAAAGRGAFIHTDVSAERIFAGSGATIEEAALSLMRASNSPRSAIVMRMFEQAHKIRMSSCSSLDLCLIASGSLTGFVDLSEPGHERSCDIAASAIVLKEAGGLLFDDKGRHRTILPPSIDALADRASLIACDAQKTADSIFEFINIQERQTYVS